MYENRLRDLREDRDLKQKDLAALLQIHQTTYSDYELGRLNIPTDTLHILADFYNVSVDYLLGRTNTKTPYPKNKRGNGNVRSLTFYSFGVSFGSAAS